MRRPIGKASRSCCAPSFRMGPGTCEAALPSSSPIFKADFPSITINGYRAPRRLGRLWPWLPPPRLARRLQVSNPDHSENRGIAQIERAGNCEAEKQAREGQHRAIAQERGLLA